MKHTLITHSQIPCMPVQWREDWTKHWEIDACDTDHWVALGQLYECM